MPDIFAATKTLKNMVVAFDYLSCPETSKTKRPKERIINTTRVIANIVMLSPQHVQRLIMVWTCLVMVH